jgi:hypothetical protein
MHLFGHNIDHDYYFELPREEERDAQSITRCSMAHHGDFRLRCRVLSWQELAKPLARTLRGFLAERYGII